MKYTFFNSGSMFTFDPRGQVKAENSNTLMNALDFHKDLVRLHNNPTCYILDNKGNSVAV